MHVILRILDCHTTVSMHAVMYIHFKLNIPHSLSDRPGELYHVIAKLYPWEIRMCVNILMRTKKLYACMGTVKYLGYYRSKCGFIHFTLYKVKQWCKEA